MEIDGGSCAGRQLQRLMASNIAVIECGDGGMWRRRSTMLNGR